MVQSIQGGNSLPQKNVSALKHASVKPDSNTQSASTIISSDSVSLSYKNSDGEELNIEVEHFEFKSTNLSRYSDDEKAHWHDVVKQIREEFKKFKEDGFKSFGIDGSSAKKDSVDFGKLSVEDQSKKVNDLIAKMPEAWRPEAVSDRIFQFVTSYYGKTQSSGADFYKIALSSIDNGFKQAGVETPHLPGDIGQVISQTRDMLKQKLEKWAIAQGILDKDGKPAEAPVKVDIKEDPKAVVTENSSKINIKEEVKIAQPTVATGVSGFDFTA